MHHQPTTTGTATHADPFTTFLDILHAAVSQDGTLETAQESLNTIEDLAVDALAAPRPRDTTPDLLRIARTAASAFQEHLDCLREELTEAWDPEDVQDQIGHYEHLLAGHRAILDKIPAR